MQASTCSYCIIVLLAVTSVLSELPADVRKCNFGDSACIAQTMNYILPRYFSTGIRSTNLVPFDPLHVKSIGLGKRPNSAVSINLQFRDLDFIGLSKAKIQKVVGFNKELANTIEVDVLVPKLTLKGPYSVDGQVLVLPIQGKGDSELIFEDVLLKIKFKAKTVDKAGKRYLHIDNGALLLIPQHAKINLTGLFNGNKALADNMLVFLNDNWRDILGELQPDISKALGLVIQTIVNNVFSKGSYDSFFL